MSGKFYWPCPELRLKLSVKVYWLESSHGYSKNRRRWEIESKCLNRKGEKNIEFGGQIAGFTIKKNCCFFKKAF